MEMRIAICSKGMHVFMDQRVKGQTSCWGFVELTRCKEVEKRESVPAGSVLKKGAICSCVALDSTAR